MINRNDVEIKNQVHQMWAEGCHSERPADDEIRGLLKSEGYDSGLIDMWFDDMQGLWRWDCSISNSRAVE